MGLGCYWFAHTTLAATVAGGIFAGLVYSLADVVPQYERPWLHACLRGVLILALSAVMVWKAQRAGAAWMPSQYQEITGVVVLIISVVLSPLFWHRIRDEAKKQEGTGYT